MVLLLRAQLRVLARNTDAVERVLDFVAKFAASVAPLETTAAAEEEEEERATGEPFGALPNGNAEHV